MSLNRLWSSVCLNRLAIIIGGVVLLLALGAAPMPLVTRFSAPTRSVVIYPNLLFAVPLILVGILLLLYGVTPQDR